MPPPVEPRRILFAVDASASCRRAFQWFLKWIWRSGRPLSDNTVEIEDFITFIHVVAPDLHRGTSHEGDAGHISTPGVPVFIEEAFLAGKSVCQIYLAMALSAGATRCDACIALDKKSSIGKAVIRSAVVRAVDLIVVGAKEAAVLSLPLRLGSVGQYVARRSRHIPVLVIPPSVQV